MLKASRCGTGASGFIATQLVKQLLEKGYTVRGTVRSTKDVAKTEVLHKLAEALPGNLELHEANLLEEGSFDSVINGEPTMFTESRLFCAHSAGQVVDPRLQYRLLGYKVCCLRDPS